MTTPPPQPVFNPALDHHAMPRLRPIRGFPVPAQGPDGKPINLLGLSDARQISERMVVTVPAAQMILPKLDGSRSIDQIVSEVTAEGAKGLQRSMLETLVAQLDDAGLLFGPTFDALLAKVRTDYDSLPILPPGPTAAFAEALAGRELGKEATEEQKRELAPAKLRHAFDEWIAASLEKADNPSLDTLPKGLIAPHLDYPRGWMNYAAAWGRVRVVDRPDRVVILGTNHFGFATGVTACDKGFETPLGVCEVDRPMLDAMRAKLGEPLFANRFDHEREHSIELQVAWIQHCLGADDSGKFCPVFGVLVHDPAVNNGDSYDGQGVGLLPFVEAMKAAIAELPGRTLVVASADLSHAGPAFGDRQAVNGPGEEVEKFRNSIVNHDREMLSLVASNKPEELVAAMAWQQNPTRWCSTGNLVAALKICEPSEVRILNYGAAVDQQGHTMVTSAAGAML